MIRMPVLAQYSLGGLVLFVTLCACLVGFCRMMWLASRTMDAGSLSLSWWLLGMLILALSVAAVFIAGR